MEVKSNPSVDKFILSLEISVAAKVVKTVILLKEFGHRLTMPQSKSLGNGLFELRIRGSKEIRIFYCFHERFAQLLHGFVKKTQQTPRKELNTAVAKLRMLT